MDSGLGQREMASSMSKPTDARSSAMASPDGKHAMNKSQKNDGLSQIIECKSPAEPSAALLTFIPFSVPLQLVLTTSLRPRFC